MTNKTSKFKLGEIVMYIIGMKSMLVVNIERFAGQGWEYVCRWETKDGFEKDKFEEFELERFKQ